jgi:hypothetical protein
MLRSLRTWCSECSGSVRWLSALSLLVACTHEGHYFDDPPEHVGARAGAGSGAAGSSATQGGSGGSTAGSTGALGGSAGSGEPSGAGGLSQGGSGARAGSAGASAGEHGTGAAAGNDGVGGGGALGGTSGSGALSGTGGVGAAGQAATGGTGDAGDTGSAGAAGEPCVPAPERCDGISNDCDEDVDEDDVCPTGCHAQTHEGHLYLLCVTTNENRQLDYADASELCDSAGGDLELDATLALARLESAEENSFAKRWLEESTSAAGAVWIGANDRDDENTWVWGRGANAVQFFTGRSLGGGTPYRDRYNDFAQGRPNSSSSDDDCGAMDSDFDWQWNDLPCGAPRLGELCEELP